MTMKQLRSLLHFLFILPSILYSGSTYAQIDAQAMICDMWGITTESHFGNYEALKQSNETDPIAWIKKAADYDDYHPQSAGGIMLRIIISGLQNGSVMEKVKNTVTSRCNSFPADSVDASAETDPISNFK